MTQPNLPSLNLDPDAIAQLGRGIVLLGGGVLGCAALLRVPTVHDAAAQLLKNAEVRSLGSAVLASVADHLVKHLTEGGPSAGRLPS